MLQEPLGDGGHAPVGGIAQVPPWFDVPAYLIDQRVFAVGFEIEERLPGGRLLPRSWDGNDEPGRTAPLLRLALQRLTIRVQRMVQFRRSIGRV